MRAHAHVHATFISHSCIMALLHPYYLRQEPLCPYMCPHEVAPISCHVMSDQQCHQPTPAGSQDATGRLSVQLYIHHAGFLYSVRVVPPSSYAFPFHCSHCARALADGFTSTICPETELLVSQCSLSPCTGQLFVIHMELSAEQQQQLLWPGYEKSASFNVAMPGCAAKLKAQSRVDSAWQNSSEIVLPDE